LALGARLVARRVACCRSCRACNKPPAPSALPPGVGLLVAGFADCENTPPAPSALPPRVGRSRGFLNVCVLRQGASRSAVSFMRAPDANLDAKFLAKKPTKLGGQRRASARRGGLVLAFCKTCNKKPTKPGGQRRASARRGGHVLAFCATFKKSKTPTDHPTPGLPSSRTKAIQEPRSKLTSDQHVAI